MKKILIHLKENWIRYGFETIVVVVGILGAYQLNNWNENRKLETLELEFLQQLLVDLTSDIAYYDRRISESKNLVENHKKVVLIMYQEQRNIEEVEKLFSMISWNSEQLTSQNSTYQELTNAGHLHIFKNQEIKKLIIDYYTQNEVAAKHIAEFNEVSTRSMLQFTNIAPSWIKFYDWISMFSEDDMIQPESWEFINNTRSKGFQLMEAALAVYAGKHNEFLNKHFYKLKDLATELIIIIESEQRRRQ